MVITGQIKGEINNEDLDKANFIISAAVNTGDPRIHMTINDIPSSLASSAQLLWNLMTPNNWLLATNNHKDGISKAKNGLQLTGI